MFATRAEDLQALLLRAPVQNVDIDMAHAPLAHLQPCWFVKIDGTGSHECRSVIVDDIFLFRIDNAEPCAKREARPIRRRTHHMLARQRCVECVVMTTAFHPRVGSRSYSLHPVGPDVRRRVLRDLRRLPGATDEKTNNSNTDCKVKAPQHLQHRGLNSNCSPTAQAIIFRATFVVAMRAASSSRIVVHKNVLLDGRLALFHKRQRWLAVADLHFGYELSQRAAGNLFPLWGMQNIEARLIDLLDDFKPSQLILLGDLVHDRAGGDGFFAMISRLKKKCDVVLFAGNHDRELNRGKSRRTRTAHFVKSWRCDEFYFHHGDCEVETSDRIQIIGHHHPTGAVRDGAGLRLKLPAFVQQGNCWIMPAFSPWAAGANWHGQNGNSKIWLCSPARILRLDS